MQQSMLKQSVKAFASRNFRIQKLVSLCMYVLLLDIAFIFLYPFLYMVITSFKSLADLNDVSVRWLLNEFCFDNYQAANKILNYFPRLFNTVIGVSLCTLGHMLACSFIGYGFARYKFRGQKFFFALLILSMIVPMQTIIVPIYILYSKIGIIPGQLPLILPSFLGYGLKGTLFIFIFRQFFLSLPPSLEEAAAIDGCGPIKAFFKIALPTARSSVLVCAVLSVVWHWNDFFEPTLYIQKQSNYYLSLMLPTLYNLVNQASTQTAQGDSAKLVYTAATMMAAIVMIILPLFLAYMVVQRKFMQGIETSGITGE